MNRVQGMLTALVAAPFVIGTVVGIHTGADETRPEDPVFSFTDPEITESSGLVVEDGLFYTVNDSGDSARIFAVDPATGDTVGHTTWDAEPLDDEAIAPAAGPGSGSSGSGDIWVGDTGDNLVDRPSVTITRVPAGPGEHSGAVASYQLVYPDGPHDAESLLVDPVNGRVLIASKDFIGGLYAAPLHLHAGINRMHKVGEVVGIATDGAFFPDGKHIVIRDYDAATFYTYPGLKQVGHVELPEQDQGEGIAVAADGEIYVSSEGEYSPVLRVELPAKLQDELDGSAAADGHHETGAAGDADATGNLADDDVGQTSWWPWLLGGVAMLGIVLVLLRALRPR